MSIERLERGGATGRLSASILCAACAGLGVGIAGSGGARAGAPAYEPVVHGFAYYAPDGAPSDWFGWSVAVGPTTVVVGAPNDDAPEAERGSVSVFEYSTLTAGWIFARMLVAPGGGVNDLFGNSVSISGDVILAAAPLEDDAGTASGAAYIFLRNMGGTGAWGFLKKVVAPDASTADQFGFSVCVDGDVALVGAWNDAAPESGRGSAYVFVRDAGGLNNWGFVKKITAPDGASGDNFGRTVSVDAGLAVIGSYLDDDAGTSSGSAYLFGRSTGGPENWGFIKKFVAPDAAMGDQFGQSVAIGDGAIVIGAPLDDDMGDGSGSAYVFMRNVGGPANWGFARKLRDAVNGVAGDQFGSVVGVDSHIAVVGSPLDGGFSVGYAILFTRDAEGRDAWGYAQNISAFDGDLGDTFGASIAIGGGRLAVGAYLDDETTRGVDCGSVSIFDSPQVVLLTSSDCNNDDVPDLLQLRLGQIADCNANGRPDACDIASGDSLDANSNGVPDECENSCPADLNGSGTVTGADLALLLGAWGACP